MSEKNQSKSRRGSGQGGPSRRSISLEILNETEHDIFKEEFDIYLTEVKASEKENETPQTVSSRLIVFTTLAELVASSGCTFRTLPISQLRSRLSPGYFCLKASSLIEISGLTTLAEYAQRQFSGVTEGKDDKNPSMSVFWTKPVIDLAKIRSNVKDPQLGGATPPAVTKFGLDAADSTSAIEAAKKQTISMKDAKAGDSLYDLDMDKWSHVVDGNELLFGFQVDTEQTNRMRTLQTSALLASDGASDAFNNVTAVSSADPWNLVQRCARPVFVLVPGAAVGGEEAETSKDNTEHVGSFYSQPMSEAKTEFSIAHNSLQIWSTRSGMSKKSLDVGASVPIGKATFGAKFGFEREKTNTEKSKTADSETHFLAVHFVPKAQVNVNETTIALSPEAEAEIKQLRRERRFNDLLRFYEKFGTLVFQNIVLGGRLFHAESMVSAKAEDEQTKTSSLKASANASLGIPGKLDGNLGGSYERGTSVAEGKMEENAVDNVSWTSIGGNASMSVDPPKWRESLESYATWRAIQYDNAVRMDTFIGRLKGFSDVPILFATILATGVLDRSVIAIPPNGSWQSKDTKLSLGAAIDPKTGSILAPPSLRKSVAPRKTLVAPAGFSWAVFSTDRNLKREIRANLQASLNPMVHVTYIPPFLGTLRANKDTFTVMLRWTSDTLKEIEDPSITEKMQDYSVFKPSDFVSEEEEKKKHAAAAKAERDAQAVAEDGGKTEDEKKANAARRELVWAKADQDAAAPVVARAKILEEEKTLTVGNYYIQSLTSQAWVIGLWTISKQPEVSQDEFMEQRVAFENEFGGPKGIEAGCDYITTKASSKDSKIVAKFKMYASDGNARDEISQPKDDQTTTAQNAYEYIDARMRLSSIHFLHVKGEIVNYDGTTPTQSPLNEPALLQFQEAQAGITFLEVKGKDISKGLTKKLVDCGAAVLNKDTGFDVTILDDIRATEDQLADEPT